jgi:hypothetical protein
MRIGRVLLISWNVLLVGFCLYLIYATVDQAITLSYNADGIRDLKEERDALRAVTLELAKGAKQDSVRQLFMAKYAKDPNHIVKDDGADTVVVDQVALRFRDGVLVGIVFGDEPLP